MEIPISIGQKSAENNSILSGRKKKECVSQKTAIYLLMNVLIKLRVQIRESYLNL